MEAKADNGNHEMKSGGYLKFALMMAASFIIMYGVMYLNVDRFEHVYLSLTRFYMTLLMIAPMAVLMLVLMGGMYKNKKLNIGIIAGSVLVFILALVFLRTQTFIGERQYMKAMIPHHSSAILTSREADLQDAEVEKLAGEIIRAQEEEIALMKQLLEKQTADIR
jgi:hypothetical protein